MNICEDCGGRGCEICAPRPEELDEAEAERRLVARFEREERRKGRALNIYWSGYYREDQESPY